MQTLTVLWAGLNILHPI